MFSPNPHLVKEKIMKRASKRNPREVTRRALKLEALERREVFAVGGLDPTFAYGLGKTVADFGGTVDYSMDSAFQGDGKIVVVGGTTAGGGDYNFALARYNSNGSLDASFGGLGGIGAGRVATDFASGRDSAEKVLIQPDGKILVVGWTEPFGFESGEYPEQPGSEVNEKRWAIARFNADGTMDNSFGVLGKVVVHRVGQLDFLGVDGAFLQGDKLLIVSVEGNSGVMSRLNLGDGSLDASFGNGGIVEFNSPVDMHRVALHQGGMVAVGTTETGNMGIARFHLDGSVDATFGVNGVATVGPNYNGLLSSLVVQSDGSIVGVGFAFELLQGDNLRLVVVRVLSSGTPDATFNVDGVSELELPESSIGNFIDVAMGSGGTIVASGFVKTGTQQDFAVVRLGADGAFDQNFGIGGLVKVDFGNSEDHASSVLTYANGKILVTGSASGDFAIARINGAAVVAIPGGPTRPGGLVVQLPNLPPTHVQPGFLLTLVERIDQAIAQHRADQPIPQRTPPSRSSVPASRINGTARANQSRLLDDIFAELGNETQERGGSNSNIANHPHQLSLRVSGSH